MEDRGEAGREGNAGEGEGKGGREKGGGTSSLAKIPAGAHGLQKFDLMRHFFV